MTSDASIMDQPLLSSKEAGALLGYTHDYISKLCREGKMSGTQKGRVWYVTETEAQAFKARHEAELEAKKAELSQKFSAIRLEHESKRKDRPRSDTVPEESFATSVSVADKAVEAQSPSVSAAPDNLPGMVVGSAEDVPEPFVPAFFTSPVLASEPVIDGSDISVPTMMREDKPEVVNEVLLEKDTVTAPSFSSGEAAPRSKHVQFAIPKQFAALAVLALIVFGPSLASDLHLNKKNSSAPSVPAYVSDVAGNLDEGVAAVLEAQSELMTRTADTYGFAQYLNDGYWALAYSAAELGKGSYGILNEISGAYLSVYEMQGETVLDSIQSIGRMGSTVVQGYELVGESLVVGAQNVVDSYADFLLVDSYAENLKKK